MSLDEKTLLIFIDWQSGLENGPVARFYMHKPILYYKYNCLKEIRGAQKRTSNFLCFDLIADTYFSYKI